MAGSIKTLISQNDLQCKLKVAFRMIVIRKIKCDGYYDMGDYDARPHAYEHLAELVQQGSELKDIYNEHVINKSNSSCDHSLYVALKEINYKQNVSEEISFADAKAMIDIVMTGLSKADRKELIEHIFLAAHDGNPFIKWDEDMIFDTLKIEVHRISDVSSFVSLIDIIRRTPERIPDKTSQKSIFYRGHAGVNNILAPSVMRSDKLHEHERAIYQQLMIECPDDFAKCRTHLERLAKMQHYQLQTRLLDVTRNPLVALFFACRNSDGRNGEVIVLSQEDDKIKDFDSDTVAVLASLPLFTRKEQEGIRKRAKDLFDYLYCRDNKCKGDPSECVYRQMGNCCGDRSELEKFNNDYFIHRLVHEVRQEKPGFRAEIIPCHLSKNYFVQALKDTPRIIRQDGAFIICGLAEDNAGENVAKYLHEFRYERTSGRRMLIIVDYDSKKKIRSELASLSIHSRSLMPEIENVAPQIVSTIKEQVGPSVR